MKTYICYICEVKFQRYPSRVSNPKRACCSKECSSKRKSEMKGKLNPNYRHGGYTMPSKCKCGSTKDIRSKLCAICSKRGFLINGNVRFTDDLLRSTVASSKSVLQVSIRLGTSRKTVSSRIKTLNLDVTHMVNAKNRLQPDSLLFILSQTPNRYSVRRRFSEIEEGICSSCGIGRNWNNKALVLQMDHINGNSCDNRFENLRWLCPNCHSQTDTFCGKQGRGTIKKRKVKMQ